MEVFLKRTKWHNNECCQHLYSSQVKLFLTSLEPCKHTGSFQRIPSINLNGNNITIEIAVAGLAKDDLAIELTDGTLSVSYEGPKAEVVNDNNEVVYQGIAQRAFKQQFTLAENVIVNGADLINGLLTINLEKIIPEEKKPRTIEIKTPKKILGSK